MASPLSYAHFIGDTRKIVWKIENIIYMKKNVGLFNTIQIYFL